MDNSDHEPRLMVAQTMWMSVRKIWSLKRYANSATKTNYQKDKKDCDRLNWSSRSWTWKSMLDHGPRHSDISMIHIEIQNGSRDTRYWVKAPYQHKYQNQGEIFKIHVVNTNVLPTQHQDQVNQKNEIWPHSWFLLFF
jgi:hypothetical protein